ncbi:hypothetical protein JG687_00004114 [Phytophthora cactorum]|uniref:Uncharacterized protein n=1 Tax=Phytophthora cactorum TaxID=29920 RepID=A0A8T1UPM6_9STRA|nr:hypothetical protein JG687_00004114 [Phytophthora cactorum]
MNANLPAGDLERSALHTIATSIYQLMKRLHHWQQAAWESLTRFFADNSSSDSCLLTFDSHPELTRLVLATITKYVKVNLLWTSFNVIPGLLALYSFLHHVQTIGTDTLTGKDTPHAVYSPLEHTDHSVREFVLHFGTAPLLAIQHDFQLQVADKGASLAALALSCFERFEMCRDLAKLRHQGVFDLESLVSGAYASHSSLPDLLNAADVVDWVICDLDPREYTDAKALQHLVALIGSTGVESVCSTIANLVVAQTLKLRSSIEAEHAVLAFMDMAMSNSSSAGVVLATTQARALDDIATQLVQIGTAAFLLQLLHDHSLHDTSDAWEARVAPRLLRELQLDPDRRATWTRLLPVACSSGFHSSVWKRTKFLSSVEATDTNAHMMGLAMARLLPSPHRSQSVNRCAVAALKRTAADTVQPAAGRSKLQLDSRLSTRPLLEALELLVTTAASGSGEAQGSALEEMDLSLERLLPHAMLVLHSAA